MPDVSIVIPSFNQVAYLPLTVNSILSQRFDGSLEVFIMDGGSTDGTRDYLRSIDDPRVSWVSEADRGQTDALNKGMTRVKGDIIGWLNSDDLYEPGALAAVCQALAAQPAAQWLVGRCIIVDGQGREIRRGVTRYKDRWLSRYRYRRLLIENFICQPAVFWRRSFGQRIGPLDESLHYAMDYDLWLRMGAVAEPLVLDRVLARFRHHDRAKTGPAPRGQFREQYAVACRYMRRDRRLRWRHRLNIEKIYLAYHVMRWLGR